MMVDLERKANSSCPAIEDKQTKNLFNCTARSFLKRPVKKCSLNTNKQSEIFCYTPQLCDGKEKANKIQSQPCVTFIIVNKERFGDGFYPLDLLCEDASKRRYAKNCVRNVASLMVDLIKHVFLQI